MYKSLGKIVVSLCLSNTWHVLIVLITDIHCLHVIRTTLKTNATISVNSPQSSTKSPLPLPLDWLVYPQPSPADCIIYPQLVSASPVFNQEVGHFLCILKTNFPVVVWKRQLVLCMPHWTSWWSIIKRRSIVLRYYVLWCLWNLLGYL